MSRLVVGITGGIGSGKTTVSNMFAARGITIVDADICARTVVEKGSFALAKIAEHFGAGILLADGSLDRARLRSIVFQNDEERLWLERLLHPLIHSNIRSQLAAAHSPYAVLVSPLLIETEQKKICHRILVVDASEEEQIKRTITRDNNSREQVEAIMKNQANRQQRKDAADDIIENSAGMQPEQLNANIEQLHQHYLNLSRQFNN
jgi:dephospho-CoA kinase